MVSSKNTFPKSTQPNSDVSWAWSYHSRASAGAPSTAGSTYTSDPNADTFPSAPTVPPTRKEYFRMFSFVGAYLLFIFGVVSAVWVIQSPFEWANRLVLAIVCVVSAFVRVLLGSWLLKAAGARLALVFIQVDILSLSVVGFFVLVSPTAFTMKALQTDLSYEPLSTDVVRVVFTGAAIKEVGKFLCYITPFLLGQIKCVSHLLYTGVIAGAMSMLYTDILTNADISVTWSRFTISVLYTMLYTLWTSMGCAIVCSIMQKKIFRWLSPLVIIIPILLHSGYIFSIAGREFGWIWAAITISYWIGSAIILKYILARVMPLSALSRRRYAPSTVLVGIKEESVNMTTFEEEVQPDDIPTTNPSTLVSSIV